MFGKYRVQRNVEALKRDCTAEDVLKCLCDDGTPAKAAEALEEMVRENRMYMEPLYDVETISGAMDALDEESRSFEDIYAYDVAQYVVNAVNPILERYMVQTQATECLGRLAEKVMGWADGFAQDNPELAMEMREAAGGCQAYSPCGAIPENLYWPRTYDLQFVSKETAPEGTYAVWIALDGKHWGLLDEQPRDAHVRGACLPSRPRDKVRSAMTALCGMVNDAAMGYKVNASVFEEMLDSAGLLLKEGDGDGL